MRARRACAADSSARQIHIAIPRLLGPLGPSQPRPAVTRSCSDADATKTGPPVAGREQSSRASTTSRAQLSSMRTLGYRVPIVHDDQRVEERAQVKFASGVRFAVARDSTTANTCSGIPKAWRVTRTRWGTWRSRAPRSSVEKSFHSAPTSPRRITRGGAMWRGPTCGRRSCYCNPAPGRRACAESTLTVGYVT